MSRIHRNALVYIGALLAAGAITGAVAGERWALAVLAAGLAAGLLQHVRMLARLERWLSRPLPEELPEGGGSWDGVLRALYRHERDAGRRHGALADALERFREAAAALPDGVTILGPKNAIEWCNDTAARHLGLDARADIGQPIGNLVRDPAFVEYMQSAKPAGARQLRLGETLFSLQLVPYAEGRKLLLSRDITQAERIEAMRRDFVANVSHELRTPLTVLVGFLETVRELKLSPERMRDYAGMMEEQANRMQRIINDLLTLSQLESAPPPAREPVELAPLLERVHRDALALSAGRHTISLSAQPGFSLLGSESELASAFGNLVTNAVRYTPAGGEVLLTWQAGKDGARFSVQDTGVGIPAEHLPRLTERFYRVDRSRSRESGGTGLGLAIVKHALARHDATLEIKSTPGKGSCFTVRFPASRLVLPSRANTTPG